MAYELDVEAVATAFSGGRREWNGRTVRFETREVATLTVTSGRLAASDPLVNPNPPAFTRAVPTGRFPVELAVAVFDDDERVAFARVRFGDTAPERWEMAVTSPNDVSGLGPDEFFGYGVDAGTGCFMDAIAGAALERRMNVEPDYFETILEGLNATQRDTWSWLDLRPDPNVPANIVCFSSGWGDGSYPTFFGIAGEQVVQVVTDFMLLPDVGDGVEPEGLSAGSSGRPRRSPFGIGALSILRWIFRGDADDKRGQQADQVPGNEVGEEPDETAAKPGNPAESTPEPTEPTEPAEPDPRTYLEFVGGSASKFYAAVVEQDDTGEWAVSFNFGRIGFPRAWAPKVEGVNEAKARRVQADLIAEKRRKGYEARPWPSYLPLPSGERVTASDAEPTDRVRGIYVSTARGQLPADGPASVGGVDLPPGMRLTPDAQGGPRGTEPVLWVTERPVRDVVERWKALARAFPETGLWPLVIEASHGIDRMVEVLMDVPRSTGADPFHLMRRWWHENVGMDEDEIDEEATSPFGRAFPGLAPRTPGERPWSIERQARGLEGHLGLVAVDRPARVLDTIGWMGSANYDLNPTEQSAILETWEDRFDAYIVGLGFDTISLAVGRPPQDLRSATAIAAEHMAFCPDNVWQGVGSISEYAPTLVDADRWEFWWD